MANRGPLPEWASYEVELACDCAIVLRKASSHPLPPASSKVLILLLTSASSGLRGLVPIPLDILFHAWITADSPGLNPVQRTVKPTRCQSVRENSALLDIHQASPQNLRLNSREAAMRFMRAYPHIVQVCSTDLALETINPRLVGN